ncbi:glutathione S-transferase theta-1-like [Toxorhynchites rutilus septentrionalis]|uniref:glutathione S-transferase theta-1-like n=1 Tax=Toxorhynchites rutilus septentrionalis TaxID=329112 RepID=UPI00247A9EF2|nr:glutathione S-transferase theta-1-like [Toxorhynchites rutilus septentrionalis]
MATRPLKYYYDLMSQPSRALFILLQQTNIPHQKVSVALRKLEHKTTEYKENINRFGKVPCIVHGDFKLAESVAIFRYLDREFGFDDRWNPKERLVRARVDEFLEWQHLNIRAHCTLFFFHVWLNPILGLPVDQRKVEHLRKNMTDSLDLFEREWLEGGRRHFVAGNDLSYADVVAACEIEQPKISGFDAKVGRPILATWMERVRSMTNPHYDQAHEIVYKLTPKEIETPALGQN